MMYSTQAIADINNYLKENNDVNLAFCVCDNQKLNKIIRAYRHNEISLENAAAQTLTTIIEQPQIDVSELNHLKIQAMEDG